MLAVWIRLRLPNSFGPTDWIKTRASHRLDPNQGGSDLSYWHCCIGTSSQGVNTAAAQPLEPGCECIQEPRGELCQI